MFLDIKILDPRATFPSVSEGDAGCDLRATEIYFDRKLQQYNVRFGVAIKVPEGHVGLIFPRSSIRGFNARLSNSVGVIDPSYTGEWKATFDARHYGENFKVGDRVAQFVILPRLVVKGFNQVKEFPETSRGAGGFGSTGRK